DSNLLAQAMTHRSWAHEQVPSQRDARNLHNEALEFLGDSILGLIVAEYLFRAYPQATEGELSRMKHRLVSSPTLAKASTDLGLGGGGFGRRGGGEGGGGARRKRALLADVFEAVIGAIFLDGGFEAARKFVETSLDPDLRNVDPASAAAADPKTMLQEKLQATHQPPPEYSVIETLGPPHRRMFHVELKWDGRAPRGSGP